MIERFKFWNWTATVVVLAFLLIRRAAGQDTELSVADAQTHAALAVVRDLVMLVRYQGGHLWTWQQDIMTKAQLLLDEHGIEWRAPPRKP